MTQIYYSDISKLITNNELNSLVKGLPEDRLNQIKKLKQPADKIRSAAAFQLLKKSYSLFTENISSMPQILKGENGKPYFKDENTFFNLSHSGERVMCAISSAPVGCDVEFKANNYKKIAKRFFSDQEYEWINENNSGERFTIIWTLKESLLKASGLGLAYPLNEFSLIQNNMLIESINFEGDCKNYYIKNFSSKDEYQYSSCGREILPQTMIEVTL